MITPAGFTFWMRAIVVQLVSTEASPKVLTAFRTASAIMTGALLLLAVIVQGWPSHAVVRS